MKSKRKTVEPVLNRNGLTFEQAIQRLEKIVADMEGAELPLEDVLKKYEEGSKLVRFCSQKLEEAEKKIELLTKTTDGVAFEPFVTESKESNDADEENEGGKLF